MALVGTVIVFKVNIGISTLKRRNIIDVLIILLIIIVCLPFTLLALLLLLDGLRSWLLFLLDWGWDRFGVRIILGLCDFFVQIDQHIENLEKQKFKLSQLRIMSTNLPGFS